MRGYRLIGFCPRPMNWIIQRLYRILCEPMMSHVLILSYH